MQFLPAVVDLHLVGSFFQQVAPKQVFPRRDFTPDRNIFQESDSFIRDLLIPSHAQQDRFIKFPSEHRGFLDHLPDLGGKLVNTRYQQSAHIGWGWGCLRGLERPSILVLF